MSSNLGAATIQTRDLPTPVGLLRIAATDQGIVSILFTDDSIEESMAATGAATGDLLAGSAKTQAPKLEVVKVLAPVGSGHSICDTTSGTSAEDHLQQAIEQLQQYFAGERKQFSLTLAPSGSPFQQQVWQALCAIPFAHSCSYGAIANHLDNPKAVRAVGAANGRNPIAIVVPCHRVIGANGSLTGYAGGLNRKLWLLQHEMQCAGR
ncbi:methylated-DNA--[protein]-cysteine S-methyltransferase [Rheinheimera riviphila]|nr:methylated-DNA--[protein]-cysteine S-methyltransferase [Rheinheimera riviphila]